MARPGVTKQEIYAAANTIVAKKQMPNVVNIRELLGRGSFNTIQKYFKSWKQDCYKKGSDLGGADLTKYNSLAEENNALKQTLIKQITKNEELAVQLMDAERNLIKVREQNLQITGELNLLKSQQQQIVAEHDKYKIAYDSIGLERKHTIADALAEKNTLIESLRNELKEINRVSIEQVKDVGRRGDDKLIDEKAKNINLQAELTTQKQAITLLQKELLQAQERLMPLRKEIERQNKVISYAITQQYEQQKLKDNFEASK